jgi:hypothetical protein
MTLDKSKVLLDIKGQLKIPATISSRMHALIRLCQQRRRHKDWDVFAHINYDEEIPKVNRILHQLRDDAKARLMKGLYVCIQHAEIDGKTTSDFALACSPSFDPQHLNWIKSGLYSPKYGQCGSTIMNGIYRISHSKQTPLGEIAEWPLSLAYTAFLFHDLGYRDKAGYGITVGFHAGVHLTVYQPT